MCGIIGISGNTDVVRELYDGLMALQHRGQDAAGIMTYDGTFYLKKGDGLVRDVFSLKHMLRLKGNLGIGHVRYPTAGCYESAEAQPFYVNSPYGICLVHNGNLTNDTELHKELLDNNRRHLNTKSDSEVILNVLADEILQLATPELSPKGLFNACGKVFQRVRGAYSVVAIIGGQGMLAMRDPLGIRPLIFGRRRTGLEYEYIFASESVALDVLGFEILRNVQPGEVIFVDKHNKVHSKQFGVKKWAPCIFEFIYLARPDSVLDDISVYKMRLRLGQKLASQIRKAKLHIDSVVPVPDSSRSAAMALAHALRVPYREGLVKNRYIGRTFIMPGQAIRKKSIQFKLNPIPLEFRKKNVLLVDDSIVRGNTSRQIIRMVREAGARKVYFASSAPPLRYPCFYGVDMPTKSDFIANNLTVEEIRRAIEADALFYQTIPDMIEAARAGNRAITGFCKACFDGKYPTSDITPELLRRVELARQKAKADFVYENGDVPEDQMTLGI
ncbi:amidophosphoribosyltransferase [Candidatus Peregrinibacteria bacterium]|nr:amidophosphoribosyltransferase [Candidatus Peregrinibacteria bacterium]